MNKLTRLMILMFVVVMATITYAQNEEADHGITKDELINLSAYVASDVDVFFTIRTGDDYIEKLADFSATAGAHWDIPINHAMIQQTFYSVFSGPFYGSPTGVSAWLGDRAAVAIPTLEVLTNSRDIPIPPIIISITDQAAADEYVNHSYNNTTRANVNAERTARDDGIISYQVTDWDDNYFIQITEDVLIISSEFDYLGTLSDSTLNNFNTFNALLGQLPADGYDLIAYVEPSSLIEAIEDTAYGSSPYYDEYRMNINDFDLTPMIFGVNIYHNRAFMFDAVAENATDYVPAPLDREMIRFVPSNALFVWHISGLGQSIHQFNQAFPEIIGQFEALGASMGEEAPFDLNHIVTFLDLMFKGTTGVRTEELADGLESDWLFYLSSVGNTFNFLNIIRSSDTDITDPAVDYARGALLDVFAGTREEDGVVKMNVPVNPVFGDQEIWFGTQDDLIVIGTEYDFKYEPRADMVTMNTRGHYNYVATFFLPDVSQLFYLNVGQIRSLLNVFEQRTRNPQEARDFREMIELLNGLESISSTTSTSADYMIGRFMLTLTEPTTP